MQTGEYIVLRYTEVFLLVSFANIKAREINMNGEKDNIVVVCTFERIKKMGKLRGKVTGNKKANKYQSPVSTKET